MEHKKISKNKIEKNLQRKENPLLKSLILKLKKKQGDWNYLAYLLSKPSRKVKAVNLDKINKFSQDNETIIVPGKVLSKGSMNHKITIAAFSFSEQAIKKLNYAKCEIKTIEELANKNAKFKIII